MRNVITLITLITLAGCSGYVARAHSPDGSELTVEEYDAAGTHSSGGGVKASPVNPRLEEDRWCQELLDKRDGVSYVLMGLGVLTGGSGLTSVIPKDMEKEKKEGFEIAFGSLTLAFGVADAVLVGVLKTLSARYEKNCMTETDAKDLPPPTDAEVVTEDADGGVEGP